MIYTNHLPSYAIVTAAIGLTVVSLYVHLINISMLTLVVGPTNLKSLVANRKGLWNAFKKIKYLSKSVGLL